MDGAPIIVKKSSTSFLTKYVDFYRVCFPKAVHLNLAYLQWLYKDNPDGEFIGADAYSGNDLVGQVVAVSGEYLLSGRLVRGLLAVNVAVHPKFQGRYLFKKLGLKMCEYGAEAGYAFVIGIANEAATPGWTRQMGFQLVHPLEARLGLGSLEVDLDAVTKLEQFKRVWSQSNLDWRTNNPNNTVFTRRSGRCQQFFASAKGKLLPVYSELPAEYESTMAVNNSEFLSPFRLFLGLLPHGTCTFSSYLSIPQKFRPSPLNLIYRSLTNKVEKLEKGFITFSFLDFDAY